MPLPNLFAGWALILAGFLSGAVMGLFFQRENWLGGYMSRPRRLIRLGHIACVALGALNILFALCVQHFLLFGHAIDLASTAFIVGGATMPVACFLTALEKRLTPLFAAPVVSLVAAAILMCMETFK